MAASGGGTIKYTLNSPTVKYTSETTQFHEECLRRGILTKEQTIVARGATLDHARQVLHDEKRTKEEAAQKILSHKADDEQWREATKNTDNENSVHNEDSDDDDDEEFLSDPTMDEALQQYRQARLQELQKEQTKRLKNRKRTFGEVQPIVRSDWSREVNDASRGTTSSTGVGDTATTATIIDPCWVCICLTASPGLLPRTAGPSSLGIECVRVERAIADLAAKFADVKFVSIPFEDAIEHWPVENLPTLFLYYNGTCRHQLIGLPAVGGPGVNAARLEWTFSQLQCEDVTDDGKDDADDRDHPIPIPPVLTTTLLEEPDRSLLSNGTSQEDTNNNNKSSPAKVTLGQLGQSLQQQASLNGF